MGGGSIPALPHTGSNPTPASTREQVSITGRGHGWVREALRQRGGAAPAPLTSPGPRPGSAAVLAAAGTARPGAGVSRAEPPVSREGLGKPGKVPLPAVVLLREPEWPKGRGTGTWDPPRGDTRFLYTPRRGCCKHMGLQGTPSPSVPFKGAKEPSGSTGADLAIGTANPLQFVPHSWFYLTGLSQAPPAPQLPSAPPEPQKNPSNACQARGHPFAFALLGYQGQALPFHPDPGVMAAGNWQQCPYIQNQVKAPLPSFPHGATISLENFISLASCPFVCEGRLGLVLSTHQMLRTGKKPTQPAEDEGLGRPRAVPPGSGDQHNWQKYPKVFFTGATLQCSPTAANEQQPGGQSLGESALHQSSPWGLAVLPWGLAVSKVPWRRILEAEKGWAWLVP